MTKLFTVRVLKSLATMVETAIMSPRASSLVRVKRTKPLETWSLKTTSLLALAISVPVVQAGQGLAGARGW